nr:hypothetical protein [Brucella anthropi]
MAYQSQFYTAGTVTVADGSAIVTGSDTGWETALIEGGVFYVLGNAYPILSVEDETKLTLATPYAGAGAAGLAYAIDRQRSAATSAVAMNDRLAQIIASIHGAQPESDILSAFAVLQGEDGKLPMFTSENTLALVDYIADAKGSLAKLAALELAASQIMQTDDQGALKSIALAANKVLTTDANGDISLSDITAAARVLLTLAGGAAANKLPYFDSESTATLADFTALARILLSKTTGAQVWQAIGGSSTSSAIKFPDGTILMRGNNTLPQAGFGGIPFPSAFPTACLGVLPTIRENPGGNYAYVIAATVQDRGSFYGTGHSIVSGGAVALAPVSFNWIAWGN